ncbi:hypothetical protein [Chitinibacter sp. GC72]|uniref:hypothetical protein n=1 Tax=Chitinibacter sp. GC72 TaxID=1526917 RepID=UPI0012FBAA5D|nr:hypothetical protein [Chitinibacter sp. GC72]
MQQHNQTPPELMSPEQRATEICRILGHGILRLADKVNNPLNQLGFSAEQSVHVDVSTAKENQV